MDPLKPTDPRRIGDIALYGRLGQGGMGLVFFGVSAEREPLAVKVIQESLSDNPMVRDRFDREIQALRMVQGPRVARLVAASASEVEHPWLAVEYVRGLTLRDYIQAHGPLREEMGAALGVLLAEGLSAIHVAGLLHRDLKPTNIVLGQDGPKVIDFGLVAVVDATTDLTASTDLLGTPACMSPEQITTPKDVTQAIDVYAFGTVLLFALTGHYPYERPTTPALLYAITDPSTPPDLSGVPPRLVPLIDGVLAKEPEARPTLAEAAEQLEGVLTAAGLSRNTARLRLAELTYVPRPDDPPIDAEPPTPSRPTRTRTPYAPTPVVARLAERLRDAYARGASL